MLAHYWLFLARCWKKDELGQELTSLQAKMKGSIENAALWDFSQLGSLHNSSTQTSTGN